MILTCIVTSSKYFFVPIQLTLITSCTIGIPSFILALEPNHNLVDGKNFLAKIIKKSLPGGLTVMFNGIIILLFKKYFNIDESITNAIAVLITGITGFIHLANISRPFNYMRGIMFGLLGLAFAYGVVFQNEFFVLNSFNGQIGLIFFLLIIFSIFAYNLLVKVIDYLFDFKNNIKKLTKSFSK